MPCTDRKLEREFLKCQYINAHHIGVLQVAPGKTMNAHMLGGILLTHIYIWAMQILAD